MDKDAEKDKEKTRDQERDAEEIEMEAGPEVSVSPSKGLELISPRKLSFSFLQWLRSIQSEFNKRHRQHHIPQPNPHFPFTNPLLLFILSSCLFLTLAAHLQRSLA